MVDDETKMATDRTRMHVNGLRRLSQKFDAAKERLVFFTVFLLVAILSQQARAHDPDGLYNNSPYKQWFESQYNATGQFCCNEADGHAYLEDYTMNPDGSVTLHDGRTLPAYMVLKGPNPTGHAVVWSIGQKYYCFAPGTLG